MYNCLQFTLSFISYSNIWCYLLSTQTLNHDINPQAYDAEILFFYHCLQVILSFSSLLFPSAEILNHFINTHACDAKKFIKITFVQLSAVNFFIYVLFQYLVSLVFHSDIQPWRTPTSVWCWDIIFLHDCLQVILSFFIVAASFRWNIKPRCKHICMRCKEIYINNFCSIVCS